MSDGEAAEWWADEQRVRARIDEAFEGDPLVLAEELTKRCLYSIHHVFTEVDADRSAGGKVSPAEERAMVRLTRDTTAMLADEAQRRRSRENTGREPADGGTVPGLLDAHCRSLPAPDPAPDAPEPPPTPKHESPPNAGLVALSTTS